MALETLQTSRSKSSKPTSKTANEKAAPQQKNRYKKRRTNSKAFRPLDAKLVAHLSPLAQLVLSRLVSGVIWNESQSYTTVSGRELHLEPGEVWCSIKTLCEDIEAATGKPVARHRVKYALASLDEFIVDRRLAFPETRGRYGIIFALDQRVMETPTSHIVDPINSSRVFAQEDVSKFLLGQPAVINDKGYFCLGDHNNADLWVDSAAKHGIDQPAFTTIGRWNAVKTARSSSACVYLPYIVFDIDRHDDVPEAYVDTLTALDDIDSFGFDMNRVFVSFSGSKGFHIMISTDQIGSPVFINADIARETMGDIQMEVTAVRTDPHTYSPLNMIRLTGSVHEKTGFYKQTWTAPDFRLLSYEQIWRTRREFLPFVFPNPRNGSTVEEPLNLLRDIASKKSHAVALSLTRRVSYKPRTTLPETFQNIVNGVREGENWHKYRAGRDWAAFTLACYVLTSDHQLNLVANALDFESRNLDITPNNVLTVWNNERCNPPLKDRQLKAKIASATKKTQK